MDKKLEGLLYTAMVYADAEQQAEFFNVVARELFNACGGRYGHTGRGGYRLGYEGQCVEIVKFLKKDGRDFIKDLYESIKVDEREIRN